MQVNPLPHGCSKLTRRGFIMPVETGVMLTREGLRQQEMFVILDEFFEVLDGERLAAANRAGAVGT
jgi:hypothetical protein